ncbi:hypothetical protein ACOMHN_052499 [Nucella lapillus]
MSMRKRKGANRNEDLKQLVNDKREGKGAAPKRRVRQHPRSGTLKFGHRCPPWRQNELLGVSTSAVEAEARSTLGPSGLRTNSPRQSLERLHFSQRGVFLRKRCTSPQEIRQRPFIPLSFAYGVLNHCPLSGHAVDQ